VNEAPAAIASQKSLNEAPAALASQKSLNEAPAALASQKSLNEAPAALASQKSLATESIKAPAAAAKPCVAGPALKTPSDITDLPQFPADCKSLLCKYLTREVYDKYKGKSDKVGCSFEQMILSGAQNVDSGIGCYAGSHDAYTTFADLFDKVIEDYHKHGKTDKHVSNMNYKELDCPPLSADDAQMIVSTRIRVGRNLADFPLGPGISKDQRN